MDKCLVPEKPEGLSTVGIITVIDDSQLDEFIQSNPLTCKCEGDIAPWEYCELSFTE